MKKSYDLKISLLENPPSNFGINYKNFDKPLNSYPSNCPESNPKFPIDTRVNYWEVEVVYYDKKLNYVLGEIRTPIKNYSSINLNYRVPFIPIRFIFSFSKIGIEPKPKRWNTPFYYHIHQKTLNTININISTLYNPIDALIIKRK